MISHYRLRISLSDSMIAKGFVTLSLSLFLMLNASVKAADFEHLLSASPFDFDKWNPAEFARVEEWIIAQKADLPIAVRVSDLEATHAYVLHCKGQDEQAKLQADSAIRACPTRLRSMIIHAFVFCDIDSVDKLAAIPHDSSWYDDAILARVTYRYRNYHFREALALSDTLRIRKPFVHLLRAHSLAELDEYRQAIYEIERFRLSNSADPPFRPTLPYELLTVLQIRLKDYELAEKTCKEGLLRFPKSIAIQANLVISLCHLDRVPEAITIARQLNSESPNGDNVDVCFVQALTRINAYEEVVPVLRSICAASPDDENAVHNLGYTALAIGDLELATNSLRRYRLSHENGPLAPRFDFMLAVCESYSAIYSVAYKISLVGVLKNGVKESLAPIEVRLLALGALANAGEFNFAREFLATLDRDKLSSRASQLFDRVELMLASEAKMEIGELTRK